jgi:DNA polymerase
LPVERELEFKEKQREVLREYLTIVRLFRQYLDKRGMSQEPKHQGPQQALKQFHSSILACRACSLYRTRTHLVFGRGSSQAKVMLVGEAPGREEDLEGRPFVGAAGKLLAKELAKIGLREEDIYVANVLKCRPPGNRDPLPEEIEACLPYLKRQIEILHPRIICSLGKFATQVLLRTQQGITSLRGKPQLYEEDIIIIPTFHPAACIYNPSWGNLLLRDLELVKRKLSG